MSFRYIGSKARLADAFSEFLPRSSNQGRFIDAFCGTGAIAEVAAQLGWPIWLNDHLVSSGIIASARLASIEEIQLLACGGYHRAIESLNALDPEEGPIWREYSPASKRYCGIERRYFTENNAGKIDAIRSNIATMKADGRLSTPEERLLIADLIGAMNRIANIAGTYGCFLSKWTKQSQSDLLLRPRQLKSHKSVVTVTASDVTDIEARSEDLVYLDPPYTKRQYASYYHIPETVALGDSPTVEGVSGLRPWRHKASDFCYKRKALKAIMNLVLNIDAKQILLSYSADGHVPIADLHEELAKLGSIDTHAFGDVGRYRPNKVASATSSTVTEYLIVIAKPLVARRPEAATG